jgi:5-methylcytosine-specific restriction enzyme subunit McrC
MATSPHVIELTEYTPQRFARSMLPDTLGESLWRDYGRQVQVDFPSPHTGGQWQLTAQGWAGYIPLSPQLQLWLRPKVPVHNLFRMWEYAYALPLQLLPGLFECRSIEEFYESLAVVLARRILQRVRQGLYVAYVPRVQALPYVRGRLDTAVLARKHPSADVPCRYREAAIDVEENQILLWTLRTIILSRLCSERTLPFVSEAYRALQENVTLCSFTAADCVARRYDRLNADYVLLHALCRFFLEGSGPGHERGDDAMLPFLVDMERLFELFVAQWLKAHLPDNMGLRIQEHVPLKGDENLWFRIDLVLSERKSGNMLAVLDTKYRGDLQPTAADIAQVVAYAQAKGCEEAMIVYPTLQAKPLQVQIGAVRVRSAGFSLAGDLESAGRKFLDMLL